MNKVDVKILRLLQSDCRASISDIAEKVNLSTSACHRRIKLLEASGKIEAYCARLDAKSLGYQVIVYAEISLHSQTDESLNDFEKAVLDCPEILECHLMAGEADYLVKVAARGTEHFERIHRHSLSHLPGVSKVKSNFVLRTIQAWEGYSLEDHLK